jgi:prepilin-type N-terminal cleavage/methylation domain-containing protein
MARSRSPFSRAAGRRAACGFTLVEILIAIAVFAVLMTIVASIFISGLRTRAEGAESMSLEREGSVTLERIMRGIYGKGGLREGNSGTLTVGDDGSSIWFDVDRNTFPTKSRADDITSLVYLLNGDVYYRPDTTSEEIECISSGEGHVESLQFTYVPVQVNITMKLSAPLPGTDRRAFIHLSKSVNLRN